MKRRTEAAEWLRQQARALGGGGSERVRVIVMREWELP